MPTYQYKCKLCDDQFEVEQSFTDDALTSLPGCAESEDGDHLLKKVFSAVGISFKGDGFYRNDSRSSKKKSSTTSSSGNGSESSSSTTSSDSSTSTSSDSSSSSSSSTATATTSTSSSSSSSS